MRSFPLIRKKHSIIDILKHIFKMIKNKGKVEKRQLLVIPKTNNYDDVEFRSLFNESTSEENNKTLPTTPEALIELVKEFDIKGKGGAAYPMSKKLTTLNTVDKESRVMIINATECDPGLFHDQWITLNLYKEVNKAANILKELFNIGKIYITSKFDIPVKNYPGVEIVKVPDVYPIGAEKALVRQVIGVEPFTYKYPVDLGVLVHNVQTMLTLYNVLFNSQNSGQHFLTYLDIENNKNYIIETSIGSKLSEICNSSEFYIGGGIMQAKKSDKDMTIDSSINFVATGSAPVFKDEKCKGCQQCTSHCPLGLDVNLVAKDEMDVSEAQKCVKCGSCSYLCPAGIDLCSKINELSA